MNGEAKRYFTKEPIIHSHVTDVLPDSHPLAFVQVYCDNKCGALVHASNNECMQSWYETEYGNYCSFCFYINEVSVSLEDSLVDGMQIRKICQESFSRGLRIGRSEDV